MPAGDAPFVSLAEVLRALPAAPAVPGVLDERPESAPTPPALAPPAPSEPLAPPAAPPPADASSFRAEPAEYRAALRDARLFRAALADSFDGLLDTLLDALAVEVLGRELRLAAVDLRSLADRLILERRADEPLRLRVAPADLPLGCDLTVIADPELRPGDAILECRSGEIDARLQVRLASVLAALEQ